MTCSESTPTLNLHWKEPSFISAILFHLSFQQLQGFTRRVAETRECTQGGNAGACIYVGDYLLVHLCVSVFVQGSRSGQLLKTKDVQRLLTLLCWNKSRGVLDQQLGEMKTALTRAFWLSRQCLSCRLFSLHKRTNDNSFLADLFKIFFPHKPMFSTLWSLNLMCLHYLCCVSSQTYKWHQLIVAADGAYKVDELYWIYTSLLGDHHLFLGHCSKDWHDKLLYDFGMDNFGVPCGN